MAIECLRCIPVPKGYKVKVKYMVIGAARNVLHDTLEKEEILITKDQMRNWRVWRPEMQNGHGSGDQHSEAAPGPAENN
jgi:hypothetical protein